MTNNAARMVSESILALAGGLMGALGRQGWEIVGGATFFIAVVLFLIDRAETRAKPAGSGESGRDLEQRDESRDATHP